MVDAEQQKAIVSRLKRSEQWKRGETKMAARRERMKQVVKERERERERRSWSMVMNELEINVDDFVW
jgi:hypothetical protein